MGEEGRRFLRYVMPGLVYGVETLLFFFIVLPESTLSVLSKVNSKEALGTSVVAFFASGALGYIFASIHHFVHWQLCFSCFEKDIFDHKNVIVKLLKARLIPPIGFVGIDGRIKQFKAERRPVKKREIAQSISLALWYHFEKDQHLGKDGIDHLGNQAHGLGTARIASFFALVTTVLLSAQYGTLNLELCPIMRYLLMLFLGVFTICIFHIGYKRVAGFAHETYTMILVNECANKYTNSTTFFRRLRTKVNIGS